MDIKTPQVEKAAPKKAKGSEELWSIPSLGVSVMASSLEESIKKANKKTDK